MFGRQSSIGVVGAGAIGGITAGFIAKMGYDVEIVCKYSDLADRIRQTGIHIFGVKGDYTVRMSAVARIQELKDKKDVVFLATKATDMMDAARSLLPYLKEDSLVVSLQNGICEDALAKVLGRERTIGCVVGWGATMHSPGELEMTSTGEFIVGNIDQKPDDRLLYVKELLDNVVPVEISDNIMGNLYSKLIINSCITSLGAICGLTLGKMLAQKKIRTLFIEIMREAMAVAAAMELHVEPYGRKLDYYKFLDKGTSLANFQRHLLIRLIGLKYRKLKSSSLQSLERGKPSEIDYLNGYIVSKAREHSIPTPVNDKIVQMIKEIEGGTRKITMENFYDSFFSSFE